jgi:hypothetical protein
MTLRTRLDRLHKVYQRNPTQVAPMFNFSQLTPEEMFELDQILAKLQGVTPRANGPPDCSSLSDVELERLIALEARITEAP